MTEHIGKHIGTTEHGIKLMGDKDTIWIDSPTEGQIIVAYKFCEGCWVWSTTLTNPDVIDALDRLGY